MSTVDEIVSQIPMASLADQLGVDQQTAESAVRQALPALVGGMEANAADPAGAASLAGALDQHSPALIDGGVNLDDVDTEDGEKIVGHVFGGSSEQVVQTLGGNLGGGGGDLIKKLLPLLAPIVLSYLAKRMRGGQQDNTAPGAGGLQDVLGSVLSGMSGGSGGQGTGSILDMLGGLLGGGRR